MTTAEAVRSPRTKAWSDSKGKNITVGARVRSESGRLAGVVKYRFTAQRGDRRVPMVGIEPEAGHLDTIPANVVARNPRHVAVPAGELVIVRSYNRGGSTADGS